MIDFRLSAVISVFTWALCLIPAPTSQAYDYGEVILQFGAKSTNWGGGGITWYDGYLWETGRTTQKLWKRDPADGTTLATYSGLPEYSVSVSYDSKDGWFWVSDPYDRGYDWDLGAYALPSSGTEMVYKTGFEPGLYESDSYYDASLDRIWVGGNVDHRYGKYTTSGKRDGALINMSYPVQGIARAGNYLYIGNGGDDGGPIR